MAVTLAAPHMVPMSSNFLVPNGTFWVELIAFVVMFAILAKYIIPPINAAMTRRQDAIRHEFEEADRAKKSAQQAEHEYKSQIADARHEAARIREEAREQGARIVADARKEGQSEAARIVDGAQAQIAADRQHAVTSLRGEVGALATTLAERIVGESLQDETRQSRVVERFLDGLKSSQDSRTSATAGVGEKAVVES